MAKKRRPAGGLDPLDFKRDSWPHHRVIAWSVPMDELDERQVQHGECLEVEGELWQVADKYPGAVSYNGRARTVFELVRRRGADA